MAAHPLPAEILLGVALIAGWSVLQCLKTLSGHLSRCIRRHDVLVDAGRTRLERARTIAALRSSSRKSGARRRRAKRPAAPAAPVASPPDSEDPPPAER